LGLKAAGYNNPSINDVQDDDADDDGDDDDGPDDAIAILPWQNLSLLVALQQTIGVSS
jgi:hypothetical protein